MNQTRLAESAEYTARREELQLAQIELMRQRERVAALRRQLPEGAQVNDCVFREGPRQLSDGDAPVSTVRLSGLFTSCTAKRRLPRARCAPCGSTASTAWPGILPADFAVAAAADPGPLRAHARARGWDQLRLLSCGDSTFKYDLGSEDADGNQDSTVSVFTLDAIGSPRHFYTGHPSLSEDIDQRGIDLLAPVWHLLDLTPQGRGDWYPQLSYASSPPADDRRQRSETAVS